MYKNLNPSTRLSRHAVRVDKARARVKTRGQVRHYLGPTDRDQKLGLEPKDRLQPWDYSGATEPDIQAGSTMCIVPKRGRYGCIELVHLVKTPLECGR